MTVSDATEQVLISTLTGKYPYTNDDGTYIQIKHSIPLYKNYKESYR